MSQHTPTTDHLGMLIWETVHNDVYETDLSVAGANNLVSKIMASEWYAAEIAAAEQRGAERVLKYFQDHVNEVSEYSYIGAAIQELIVQASENRADQIEGDDEKH